MSKIKEIKQLSENGEYISIPIGCDAKNIDMDNGNNVEDTINGLKEVIDNTATTTSNGLMSAEDKTKLDNIPKLDYTTNDGTYDIIGQNGYNLYLHGKAPSVSREATVGVQDSCIMLNCSMDKNSVSLPKKSVNVTVFQDHIDYTFRDSLMDDSIYTQYTMNEGSFYPYDDEGKLNGIALGLPTVNYAWKTANLQNSPQVVSDRKQKKDINDISNEQAINIIKNLKPSTYKYVYGESDRTHYGMISQDVEDMLQNLGMSTKDFAAFIKSPHQELNKETGELETIENEYDYMLRYEEFIAPIIKVNQYLLEEVSSLKEEIQKLKSSE